MQMFGGSEIIILELIEAFRGYSCNVDLCINHCGEPVLDVLRTLKITPLMISSGKTINPFSYDIVWNQHQLLPLLLSTNLPNTLKYKTFFCFAHLSPYEPMEGPGIVCEDLFADLIFANSQETKLKLENSGFTHKEIDIFYNAAPNAFHTNPLKREKLGTITVVSNHIPKEILGAATILKEQCGINFIFLGSQGPLYRRVCPSDILQSDAIICIGKTVQYAIAGNCPVFCYDRFGGPGWITLENFKTAEEYNYSGRCCSKKMSPVEIAVDIVSGFFSAADDILKINEVTKKKYALENYIERIINGCRAITAEKEIHLENIPAILREGENSKIILNQYKQIIQRGLAIDTLTAMHQDELNKNSKKDTIIEQLYHRIHGVNMPT